MMKRKRKRNKIIKTHIRQIDKKAIDKKQIDKNQIDKQTN